MGQIDRWAATQSTPAAVAQRWYGSLDQVIDSERRALRPIGSTVGEVAARTSDLLTSLFAHPGVRIFLGVRAADTGAPRIPHAVSAGRALALVESVAWPPGRYTAAPTGQIHCDGVYIGQSVLPLITAVGHWREILPLGHQVSAFVVVHPAGSGDLALPATAAEDLTWAHADQATRAILAHLPSGQAVSLQAVLALLTATETGYRADAEGPT